MNRKRDIMLTLSQNKVGIFILISDKVNVRARKISRKRALHNEKGANSPRRNGNSQCVYA